MYCVRIALNAISDSATQSKTLRADKCRCVSGSTKRAEQSFEILEHGDLADTIERSLGGVRNRLAATLNRAVAAIMTGDSQRKLTRKESHFYVIAVYRTMPSATHPLGSRSPRTSRNLAIVLPSPVRSFHFANRCKTACASRSSCSSSAAIRSSRSSPTSWRMASSLRWSCVQRRRSLSGQAGNRRQGDQHEMKTHVTCCALRTTDDCSPYTAAHLAA